MFTARISRHQLIDSSEERSKCAQSIADRLKQLQNDHQVGAVRDSMFSTFMRLLSELEGWSKTDAATELSSEAEAEQSSAKQSERIYVVQSLLLCLQVAEELVHCQCLAFGDLLDLYTELLDVSRSVALYTILSTMFCTIFCVILYTIRCTILYAPNTILITIFFLYRNAP